MARSVATALDHFKLKEYIFSTRRTTGLWLPGEFLLRVPAIPKPIVLSYDYLLSLVLFTRAPSPPNSSSSQLFLSSLHPLNSFIHHPLQLFAHPSQLLATCLSILSVFSVRFAHIVSTLLLISVTIQTLSVRSLQPLLHSG